MVPIQTAGALRKVGVILLEWVHKIRVRHVMPSGKGANNNSLSAVLLLGANASCGGLMKWCIPLWIISVTSVLLSASLWMVKIKQHSLYCQLCFKWRTLPPLYLLTPYFPLRTAVAFTDGKGPQFSFWSHVVMKCLDWTGDSEAAAGRGQRRRRPTD